MLKFISSILATCVGAAIAWAQPMIDYRVSLTANAGSGDFAPHYIMSNVHGTVTQPYSTLLRASAWKQMDTTARFSYGFGADVIGGYSSPTAYERYGAASGTLLPNEQGPAPVWLQQLYAEVKYRCLYITVGMKEHGSVLVDDQLSSGDMAFSANARPMPGFRAGFVDFQDFPGTRGWLQVRGELSYAKSTGSQWLEDHYNYYQDRLTTDEWYCYKYVHLRSNPHKPFSFLVGMQSTCQFGGKVRWYVNGVHDPSRSYDNGLSAKDFLKALVPSQDDSFYAGNHLGTWDVLGRYRFGNGRELRLYYQSPWEDGSGIGKLNGFDGLYGLEFKNCGEGLVEGAVVEYIDLTNHSGPMHWAPGDFELGSMIPNQATGADDYYNNTEYNGYQTHGLAIGSPMLRSPIYNTNGYIHFNSTRLRGFHIGVNGHLAQGLSYRLLASYRKSWGTPYNPSTEIEHCTSVMLEGCYQLKAVKGLAVKAQLAMDRGSLLGDNCGALLTVSYDGAFNL